MLVDAREKLHIPWGDPDNQSHGDSLMAIDTRSTKMARGRLETSSFLRYLSAVRALWDDSGIQNAYDRRREFQLVRRRASRRDTGGPDFFGTPLAFNQIQEKSHTVRGREMTKETESKMCFLLTSSSL